MSPVFANAIAGADPWTHANIPASLAQYDYISGTQNYHSSVSLIFTAEKGASEPGFFDDSQYVRYLKYTHNTDSSQSIGTCLL